MPANKTSAPKKNGEPSLLRTARGKTDALLATMRQLARKQQRNTPHAFISLRKAAEEFGVPMSAMAVVYRRLADEGLLSSVRGSRTMLLGRDATRTLTVRSVIGMPLSLPRLQTFRAYRECYLSVRQELHRRGFAVSPLYHDTLDISPEEVADRAGQERVDIVAWVRPQGIGHDTALRLRDLGIRFVGINIGGVVGGYCRYEIRRRQAIGLILHEWRTAANFGSATLVRAGEEEIGEAEHITRLRGLATLARMAFDVADVPDAQVVRFLVSLCEKKHTGILLAASAAGILGTRANDRVTEVLTKCRIALIDGPMDFPFSQQAPDGAVDLVAVDWPRLGQRIAQDILTGEAFAHSESVALEADAYLQLPLTRQRDANKQTERLAA